MAKYPYSKNGIIDSDGKNNTDLMAALNWIDIDLSLKPIFPAAAAAKNYGVTVADHTTGLEAGAWWLPSNREMLLLVRDRKIDNTDQVNVSLTAISGDKMLASGVPYWTSSEFASTFAWTYNGFGSISGSYKHSIISCRAVTAF